MLDYTESNTFDSIGRVCSIIQKAHVRFYRKNTFDYTESTRSILQEEYVRFYRKSIRSIV